MYIYCMTECIYTSRPLLSPFFLFCLCVCIFNMSVHSYLCLCMHIYVHVYTHRRIAQQEGKRTWKYETRNNLYMCILFLLFFCSLFCVCIYGCMYLYVMYTCVCRKWKMSVSKHNNSLLYIKTQWRASIERKRHINIYAPGYKRKKKIGKRSEMKTNIYMNKNNKKYTYNSNKK